MSENQSEQKITRLGVSQKRGPGGIFMFSVAVGAAAVGVYYWLSNDAREAVNGFLCSHLHCPQSSKHICGEWDHSWDKKALAKFLAEDGSEQTNITNGKKSPIYSRHLIFVRHGQYHDTQKDDEQRKLTEKGRQQATWTGKKLREMGIKFDLIVHSTMKRAVETTDLIVKEIHADKSVEVSLSETDLLREGHPIVPVPYYGKSITDKDQERIEAAFANFFHRPPPSQTRDTYELYVCHANVIRYLTLRALQLAPTAWLRFSIAHASITWITIRSDGSVSLRRMGEAGHIPWELESR